MSEPAPTATPEFSPLGLPARSLLWKAAAVVIGTVLLALASYIVVPMFPIPMTMQTFAVTLIGALYGWRLGAFTVAVWLIEGAAGLPVLAGGAAGAHHFIGPTAGYLFAFPVCAALTGWLAEIGWNGSRLGLCFLAMVLGNLACLAIGAAWLAVTAGADTAIFYGVIPFLLGGALKSGLAAAALHALARGRARRG